MAALGVVAVVLVLAVLLDVATVLVLAIVLDLAVLLVLAVVLDLPVVLDLAVVLKLDVLMALTVGRELAVEQVVLYRCWLLDGRDVCCPQVALCSYHSDFPSARGSILTNWMSHCLQPWCHVLYHKCMTERHHQTSAQIDLQ